MVRNPVKPPSGTADSAALELHAAALHLLRRLRIEDRASGIPPAQLSALSVIVFGGPVRASRLATIEEMALPSMSRLIDALEKAGHVRRRPDPADGRAELIEATAQGTRVMHKARDTRVRLLAAFLGGCSDAEREAALATASLIRRFLASTKV